MPVVGLAGIGIAGRLRALDFLAQRRHPFGPTEQAALVHGCHAFPDAVAIDQGDNPQWLYTVVFESAELWGPDADPTLKISIDAFEPYLDPA